MSAEPCMCSWLVNPWHNPDFPAEGISLWTTCQGGSDMGDNIASTEGTINALDRVTTRHEEVTTATRTKLAVMVVPLMTATEIGTHAYVLQSLLGEACLVVQTILPLFNWIYRNRTEWVFLMADHETTARLA